MSNCIEFNIEMYGFECFSYFVQYRTIKCFQNVYFCHIVLSLRTEWLWMFYVFCLV